MYIYIRVLCLFDCLVICFVIIVVIFIVTVGIGIIIVICLFVRYLLARPHGRRK